MTTVGSGRYTYEVHEKWAVLPTGWTFGPVSAVATDSQDRVYAFQRKDPPIVVFDRNGQYLTSWGRDDHRPPRHRDQGRRDLRHRSQRPSGHEVLARRQAAALARRPRPGVGHGGHQGHRAAAE